MTTAAAMPGDEPAARHQHGPASTEPPAAAGPVAAAPADGESPLAEPAVPDLAAPADVAYRPTGPDAAGASTAAPARTSTRAATDDPAPTHAAAADDSAPTHAPAVPPTSAAVVLAEVLPAGGTPARPTTQIVAAIGPAAAAGLDPAGTRSAAGSGATAAEALRGIARGGRAVRARRFAGILRTALAGALDTGAFDTLDAGRRTVRAVRMPLGEPRSIAVVAGRGGVGNTTTAVGLAAALAALRDDETVVVGASGGAGAASSARLHTSRAAEPGTVRTGAPAPAWVPADHEDRTRQGGQPGAEFRAGPGGPYVVDGGPEDDLGPRLDALRQRYAVIVADAGNELTLRAHSVVGHAGQIVVVTDAGGGALEATRRVFERLASGHRSEVVRTAVVAVVGGRAADRRRLALRIRSELGVDPAQIVEVPHDEGLAAPGHFDPARLTRATRWAYATVLAAGDDGRPATAGTHAG
ncbi:hypothetical protein ABZS66_51085 [Dactylosporangium sp. NPDC005572]|uniref:hypothetical protein n=1 Tax=Dactylosporangium sp. NPDC005572 TaxID=3156889 RepID=UPI0033A834A3